MSGDYSGLPDDLPAPDDEGATDGLVGQSLPDLSLPSTQGGEARLPDLAARLLVAYVYPMTGTPGRPLPHGWDDIPGARGLHPAELRLPRCPRRVRAARRRLGRDQRPERHRAGRVRAARAHPLPAAERRGPPPRCGSGPTDLRGRRQDLLQTPHVDRRRGADRQGLLPRLPTRPRRRRGARLAGRPRAAQLIPTAQAGGFSANCSALSPICSQGLCRRPGGGRPGVRSRSRIRPAATEIFVAEVVEEGRAEVAAEVAGREPRFRRSRPDRRRR